MKQYNTFFYCQNAKFLWRLISAVFNLPMPLNVNHMFTHWLYELRKQRKHQALVGACAILWAIWLTRNNITFNYARLSLSLQVLFRGTYWIQFWALQQKEEERPPVLKGCRALECLAVEVFASNGCPFSNRIACV